VPNSPNDGVARPKRYRPRARGVVAAVGWVQRALVMLTITPEQIILEHTTSKGSEILRQTVPIPPKFHVAAAQAGDVLAPLAFNNQGRARIPGAKPQSDEVFFLDARRALFLICTGSNAPLLEQLASEVSAFIEGPRRIAYVGRDPNGEVPTPYKLWSGVRTIPAGMPPPELDHRFHLVAMSYGVTPSTTEALVGDGTFEAFLGGDEPVLMAVQQRGEAWSIPPRGGIGHPIALTPPSGTRVVGVSQKGPMSEPELIVLDPDRRTISCLGRHTSRVLARATSPIVEVATSARAQLAYLTMAGEVVIHALRTDALLARFSPDTG
jgi:hypothetical protein